MNSIPMTPTASRSQGFALFVSLMFLIILTLIGLVAMTTTSLQATMAGNEQDHDLAFESAEAALREGEAQVASTLTPGSGFNASCTGGLCTPSTTSQPDWSWTSGLVTWGSPGSHNIVVATTLPGVSIEPEYIVERLPSFQPSSGGLNQGIGGQSSLLNPYRVTAVGWGARATTHVMLQSVYVK